VPTRSANPPRKRLLVHLSRAVETLALRKPPANLEMPLEGSLNGSVKLQFFEVNDREFTHFENISDALNRVDKGTYGRCIFCGGSLEAELLKQTPWATECAGCGDQEPQP
jgi:hypothetical protein